MSTWERVILHVDMDAFYASVEVLDDPALAGLPVLVGGRGERGVVAAASYEARRFGIRSAMPSTEARRRCPDAVFLPPRMDRYREVSDQVFDCFRTLTPTIEGLSLDEAFLDLTGDPASRRDPVATARELKQLILDRTGLRASVGVAPNKLVAKIASDMDKPDGLTVIPRSEILQRLGPLPVERLWGVGPQAASRLKRIGVHTLAELADTDARSLERVFGRSADRLRARARGEDSRPVGERSAERSISAEETFSRDLDGEGPLAARLDALADKVCGRLRRTGSVAGCVTLKIRDHRFDTRTRQRRLPTRTAETAALRGLGRTLLQEWLDDHPRTPVRLLGFGVSGLAEDRQLGLFGDATGDPLDQTLDEIRARYGPASLKRGRGLD